MNVTELSEPQAEFLNRLVEQYPNGLGYNFDRDEPIRELAEPLIDAGYVKRVELAQGISYRLADEHAEGIRDIAAKQAEQAQWN